MSTGSVSDSLQDPKLSLLHITNQVPLPELDECALWQAGYMFDPLHIDEENEGATDLGARLIYTKERRGD